MWRLEDREFYIIRVMLLLDIHDIYLLMVLPISETQEVTHPSLVRRSTIGLLVDYDCGGVLDSISGGSLNISKIIDSSTQVVSMMVV